jgi:membrane-associated phospholipid phosphatase
MVTGYLAFMLTSVAVLAVITTAWKISIHCAVASGSVAILALTYGPLVLPGFLLVALLGWSRVSLKDHTTAQVVGGMVLGALAALLAYATLAGAAGLSRHRQQPGRRQASRYATLAERRLLAWSR